MEERELLEYLRGRKRDAEDYQKVMSQESRKKLQKIWDEYSVTMKKGAPDFDVMLNNIHHKLGVADVEDRNMRFIIRSMTIFRQVAVILFLPLLGAIVYFLFTPSFEQNEEEFLEISTLPGTVTQLILSDSTHVWLNQSTSFRYPREFKGKERLVVVLEGEAYFEVTSDKDNPFIVDNAMMKTTVTGTKFNISTSIKRGFFEASLIDGEIILENAEHKLSMNPGSIARFNTNTKSLTYDEKPVALHKSWIDGELHFEDEPLWHVFEKLSDWYNVDFVLKDDELKNLLLTAKIKFENLEQFLGTVTKSLPIRYTIEVDEPTTKKIVYISKN
ncbi:DUF4974 domain-containing protein [Sphingobacterium phlebotomi]|uniref:DUF4974 domain-containing protein n=1 Tax=Sphingobacterium phlebotomi TaxID=2605433 RepID=A0A5D4HBD2_9SPHI|nr:FecR family protein [Sphingobacterium phlebotomi]TYR38461.1 DUF4974 domain-containing protein [Sphingobacterium phlebotomi]